MEEIAVGVRDDLKLDMMGIEHQFFQITFAIAETGHRFIGGRDEEGMKILGAKTRAHAAASASRRGLDHHRKTDLAGFGQSFVGIDDDVRPRSDRHAIGGGIGAGRGFVAHHRNHLG